MNVTIYYKRECGRIRYFGLRKNKANSKIALKISVNGLYFKGLTFFSFLILHPGEDYNSSFLNWSAQVKCQRTVFGCRGGNWSRQPVQAFLYRLAGKQSLPDRKSTRLNFSHGYISYA